MIGAMVVNCRRSVPTAGLVMAALLVVASRATAQSTDRNVPGYRAYTVQIPDYTLSTAQTGKVKARTWARCGHGFQQDERSQSGVYVRITRTAGSPPTVTTQDLDVGSTSKVAHAEAYAHAAILPEASINGDSVTVRVRTVRQERTNMLPCDDGASYAFADAKDIVDPIVFGSLQYASSTGENFDPLPPQFDGVHRYVEQQLALSAGGLWVGGLPGPSPKVSPDGTRATNQVIISHYVRAGSDDDPDNLAGVMMYQLGIVRGPGGGLVVSWTPGTDTADFSFSFSQAPAAIEAGVAAYFAGANTADLPLGTIRVTMLQDETTMPNMTLVGYDVVESWSWDAGNPMAFGGIPQWWQSPDMSAGNFRTSTMLGGPIRADDFMAKSAAVMAVDGLRWWGTYAGETGTHRPNSPYVLPFTINWYSSDGAPHPTSLPLLGPPLTIHTVQANRYFLDWDSWGNAIYEFNARLAPAFLPPAPSEYFISIADTANPTWAWMDATSTYLDTPALSLGPMGPWQWDLFPDLSYALFTAIAPDGDRDGDVDLTDYGLFMACFSGPTIPATPGCQIYDFDPDLDVDQADFGVFQRCYSGADRTPDPTCLN